MKSKHLIAPMVLGIMAISSLMYSETNISLSNTAISTDKSAQVADYEPKTTDYVLECLGGTGLGLLVGTLPGLYLAHFGGSMEVVLFGGLGFMTLGNTLGAAAGSYLVTRLIEGEAHPLGTALGSLAGTALYLGIAGCDKLFNAPADNTAMNTARYAVIGTAIVGYFVFPALGGVIGNHIEENLTRNSKNKMAQLSLQVAPVISSDSLGLLAGIQF